MLLKIPHSELIPSIPLTVQYEAAVCCFKQACQLVLGGIRLNSNLFPHLRVENGNELSDVNIQMLIIERACSFTHVLTLIKVSIDGTHYIKM
jgi:hypothetical protein